MNEPIGKLILRRVLVPPVSGALGSLKWPSV